MKRVHANFNRPFPVSGITLIELLVSLALGLLLTAGAIATFVSSKQIYRTEDALSHAQESGRFITELLGRRIRIAGYVGCSNLEDITPNVVATPAPSGGFQLSTAFEGYDDNGTNGAGSVWVDPATYTRVAGTDVITIGSGGECGVDLTAPMGMPVSDLAIPAGNSCNFNVGETLLVTDCLSADLFRASGVGGVIEHANDNVYNTGSLSAAYETGATVYKFQRTSFFIGIHNLPNPERICEQPCLVRVVEDGSTTTDELVENVEDMQLQYGIDTGNDGLIDSYRTASAITDWTKVLAVRIGLLFSSDGDNITLQPQTITFNGNAVNTGANADKRLRTIFDSVVAVRNRVP